MTDPFPDSNVRDARVWQLLVEENCTDVDLRVGTRITGQFTAQDMNYDYGSVITESGGFSRANPIIQWVGSKLEVVTFQARVYSDTQTDFTARDKIELFKLLCKPHQPMNRPPVTRFFWGNMIPGGISCLVESLGGMRYDEIKETGDIRGATLNLTLKKWTEPVVDRRFTSPTARTPTQEVKEGDTYELIAYQYYGDPLLGVPLRQLNPRFPMEKWAPRGYADLTSGELVKLLPRSDLEAKRIKPESHIFNQDNSIAAGMRRRLFALRQTKTGILLKK